MMHICLCTQTVFALQSGEQVDKISASLGTYDVIAEPSTAKQYTLEAYSYEHFRLLKRFRSVSNTASYFIYIMLIVCILCR